MSLRRVALADLSVRGERAFREVPLYGRLKARLREDRVSFLVADVADANPERVRFLNLTFWHAGQGSDVLAEDRIDADVVAHAAWHHAAASALDTGRPPTAPALFLGESGASAFDVYVVGRMLRTGRQTAYLRSQMPLMAAAASEAGLAESEVAALFQAVVDSPEAAFDDLRELLYDASLALLACEGPVEAADCLGRFDSHRFSCLLHHYALSSWVLHARAYAASPVPEDRAIVADAAMRAAPGALLWLETNWLPRA